MIGLRTGLATGLRTGLAIGISADEIRTSQAASAWSVDATSGIAAPSSATEWAAFLSAKSLSAASPSSLWLCQEDGSVGHTDLADSIGAFPLIAQTAPLYGQAVPGWSRKGVGFDQTSNQRFISTDAALPDISTTSATLLAFVAADTTPAAARGIVSFGTTTARFQVTTTPALQFVAGTTANEGANCPTAVQPLVIKVDKTAGVTAGYTIQSNLANTVGAITGKAVRFGALTSGSSFVGKIVYAAMWSGASAEISDANMKALLVAMGWTIPWS